MKKYKRLLVGMSMAVIATANVFAGSIDWNGDCRHLSSSGERNTTLEQLANNTLEDIKKIESRTQQGSIPSEAKASMWFARGQSYVILGMDNEAMDAFKKSINHDSSNLMTYNNISYLLNKRDQYQEALEISEWIIQKDNILFEPYINKGYALLGLGEGKKAAEAFEEAIARNNDNITAYVGMAKAYSAMGKHNEAVDLYDAMIRSVKPKCELESIKFLRGEEIKKLSTKSDNGGVKK